MTTEERAPEPAVGDAQGLRWFERLFRHNPAPMAVSSLPESRFIDVNEAFLDALGFTRDEVLGHTVEELDLLVEPRQQRAAAARLQAQGRVRDHELRVRRKEGAVLDGFFSGEIIEDSGQQYLLTVIIDQTERKEAEAALRESAAKYRMVADFAYDWEAWRAPDGTYRYVSPSCVRITGHAAAEFLAHPNLVVQITHPDDWSKVVEHFLAGDHEARERDLELDFRILTPSGEIRWISHRCTAVYAEGGQWLGRRESNRDVTERKRVEDALRASEEQLDCAVEGSGVGLWDWQVQSGEEVFNERWAETVGYTLAELSPTSIETWRGFCHPEDLQRADELLEEHFSGQSEIYACETRMRHKDGHWVWVLDRGKVSRWGSDRRPLRMIGTQLDISARKQAEAEIRRLNDVLEERVLARTAELAESEAKYRDVVERATDGIAILQGGLVVFANEALAKMSGYTTDELESMPFLAMVSPPRHAEVAERVRRRLDGEQLSAGYDIDLVRKDGTPFSAEVRGGLITYEGASADLAFVSDITARKRAEEKLRLSEDKFAKAFHSSPDAILISRLSDGYLVEINEGFLRLSGFTREEALGSSTLALDLWALSADRARYIAALQRDGSVRGLDFDFRVKSGDILHCLVAGALIEVEGETHVFSVVRDVTEQRRTAIAVRESEALLRGILDNMQDAYVRTADDGRFVMVSPSAARMYGYDSVEEMIGLPASSLYADQADREAMFEELRRLGSVNDYAGRGRRKDGSTFSVSLNAQFYRDDAGNVLGSEGFVRDVSERRPSEDSPGASEE